MSSNRVINDDSEPIYIGDEPKLLDMLNDEADEIMSASGDLPDDWSIEKSSLSPLFDVNHLIMMERVCAEMIKRYEDAGTPLSKGKYDYSDEELHQWMEVHNLWGFRDRWGLPR